MTQKTERHTDHHPSKGDGSDLITVRLTHERLPPITLTFTLKGAAAMFADAYATRRLSTSVQRSTWASETKAK